MLCVTGLPLIFHSEIDRWIDPPNPVPRMAPDTPILSLDTLVSATKQRYPQEYIRWISLDAGKPVLHVGMGPTPEPGPGSRYFRVDARTAEILDQGIRETEEPTLIERAMHIVHSLHEDLFLGLPGELFLGGIGLVFIVSLVSGAIVYRPFIRKFRFGKLRAAKSSRTKWLDIHNLLGITTVTWALIVGFTGAFNTLSGVVLDQWVSSSVHEQTASYRSRRNEAVVEGLSSVQGAVDSVHRVLPDMRVGMIVYPNKTWVSPHHYLMWAWGTKPLTAKLRTAILVDATTGEITSSEPLPWYMRVLDLARPLHFGDYGGLPLKILWAILDLITIGVLASGLYIWVSKRRSSPQYRTMDADNEQAGVSSANMRNVAE